MTSIQRTLQLNYFVVIGVMALVSVLFVLVFSSVHTQEQRFNNVIFLESGLIARTQDIISAYNGFRNSDTVERKEVYAAAAKTLRDEIDSISAQSFQGADSQSIIGIHRTADVLLAATDAGVQAIERADVTGATTAYDEANRLLIYIPDAVNRLVLEELLNARSVLDQLAQRQRLSQFAGIGLLIVVTVTAVATSLSLSRRIARPLEQLSLVAEKTSHGDLAVSIDAKWKQGSDEIATLANAFDNMLSTLRSTIDGLQQANARATIARDELGQKNGLLEKLNALFISREERIRELKEQLKDVGIDARDGSSRIDSGTKGV